MKANMFRNMGAAVVLLLGGAAGASVAQSFVITGALVVWAFAYPDAAAALEWNPDTGEVTDIPSLEDYDAPDEPASPPSLCGTWESPPRIVIHNDEFLAGGGDGGEQVPMHDAIDDVIDQFNLVGATSAEVTSWESNSDPFVFKTWFDDPTPTIHVGFVSSWDDFLAANGLDSSAGGVQAPKPEADCRRQEAHIAFPVLNERAVNFGTPFGGVGEPYYETGDTDESGAVWFRPQFLHELLHAFGLVHSTNTYAFMNYNDFPWANRPDDDAIRPLPADVRTLRELYPEEGESRTEVAVLTTWYKPPAPDAILASDIAIQHVLCKPSLGTDWNPFYYPTCGTGGPDSELTEVCEGDTLRTRYVLANYSTEKMTFWAELWFSVDETWDSNDVQAPSQLGFDVDAAHSALRANTWTVPSLTPGVDYHPIVRVVSGSDTDQDGIYEGSTTRTDWIPLPGTVEGC